MPLKKKNQRKSKSFKKPEENLNLETSSDEEPECKSKTQKLRSQYEVYTNSDILRLNLDKSRCLPTTDRNDKPDISTTKKGSKSKSKKSNKSSKILAKNDNQILQNENTFYNNDYSDHNYHCCHTSMTGRRPDNEDTFSVDHWNHYNLYAIFDGHCGDKASKLASQCLFDHFKILAEASNLSNTKMKTSLENKTIEELATQALKNMDDQLYKRFTSTVEENFDGSTVIWLIHNLINNSFHVINLGDSRCLVFQDNHQIFITKDHKPTDQIEKNRIELAGGYIEDDRLNGDLAVSRGLGDFEYKNRAFTPSSKFKKNYGLLNQNDVDGVSIIPDIEHLSLTDRIEASYSNHSTPITIILACDGLFDVFDDSFIENMSQAELNKSVYERGYGSIQELINLIDSEVENLTEHEGLVEIEDEEEFLSRLTLKVMLSAFDLGSQDNISVILLRVGV